MKYRAKASKRSVEGSRGETVHQGTLVDGKPLQVVVGLKGPEKVQPEAIEGLSYNFCKLAMACIGRECDGFLAIGGWAWVEDEEMLESLGALKKRMRPAIERVLSERLEDKKNSALTLYVPTGHGTFCFKISFHDSKPQAMEWSAKHSQHIHRMLKQFRNSFADPEIRELAKHVIGEVEKRGEEQRPEATGAASDVPNLDVPGPTIERPPIARAKEHFTRSDSLNAESRREFAAGLVALAKQPLQAGELKDIEHMISIGAEMTFSALREVGGSLVTLRFDDESAQVELVSLDAPKAVTRSIALPKLEVVPIEYLSARERAVLAARREAHSLSKLRMESMTPEQRRDIASHAGKMLGEQMSKEEREDRARKGGLARGQRLTPEERSELARKAVQARWARKQGENAIKSTESTRDD